MSIQATYPHRLSIIIEWDNVRIAELDRAKTMLARLGDQLHNLHSRAKAAEADETRTPRDHLRWFMEKVELLIGYNSEEIDPKELEPIVRDFFNHDHAHAVVTLLPVPEANYYRLKNTCVKQAAGDLIVFVDSDVIPEENWLESLVAPFVDQRVKVVAGNTYLEPNSFYSRTLALSFFFPLRAEDGPLRETDWFFANNCAFRKQVLLDHPFPERTDQFRGQCDELARGLIASGEKIYATPNARVHHPPPNGLRHFINRAVCEGHDFYLEAVHTQTGNANGNGSSNGSAKRPTLRSSFGRARRRLGNAFRRIRRQRQNVGLSALGVPAAMAISTSYYSFYLMGELLGRANPQVVRKYFSI